MKRLRELRERHGISQQSLADKLGVSQQTIQQYEKGKFEPDISTLKWFSDFFGVSVDYLIENTDYPFVIIEEEADLYNKYHLCTNENKNIIKQLIEKLYSQK